MKSLTKILSLAFFVASSFFTPVVWSICQPGTNPTTVFYVNGVNNDGFDALTSMLELEKKLNSFLIENPIDTECVDRYRYAYNANEPFMLDLFEAAGQIILEDFSAFWRYWGNIEAAPDEWQEAWLNIASQIDLGSYVIAKELEAHVKHYKLAIDLLTKVVLVGHSQGNLYANAAYRDLQQSNQNNMESIGLVAVSTPSNRIEPFGALGGGPYATLSEDRVAKLFLPLGAKRANTTNQSFPFPCLLNTFCHNFVQSYLEGDESGPQILQQISDVIQNLEPPVPPWPLEIADDLVTISESSSAVPLDVLDNDGGRVGDNLTVTSVTQGANGVVENIISDVTYTPDAGFVGTDTFTYTVSDGHGRSDTATVTVTVTAVVPTTYSITPQSVSVGEGDATVSFTISRSDISTAETIYVNTLQNQGFTNNGDYIGQLNEAVNFAAGDTDAPVTVTINDDFEIEDDETFGIVVEGTPDGVDLASATFTIVDNDGGGAVLVEDFESYPLGPIDRQSNGAVYWTDESYGAVNGQGSLVTSNQHYDGIHSLYQSFRISTIGSDAWASLSSPPTDTTTTLSYWLYYEMIGLGVAGDIASQDLHVYYDTSPSDTFFTAKICYKNAAELGLRVDATWFSSGTPCTDTVGTIVENTWHQVFLEINWETDQVRGRVDTSTWSPWVSLNGSNASALVVIDFAHPDSNSARYIDRIEIDDAAQPLPGGTVELTPSMDIWTTSVFSYDPDTHFDGIGGGLNDDRLIVGGWGDWYYSLLQFDLSGITTPVTNGSYPTATNSE